jgi:hypothetical protein
MDDKNIQPEAFKKNLKDHIFNLNKKNIKVADPNLDLRGVSSADIWGEEDPIHPLEAAMAKTCGRHPPDGLQAQREANRNSAGGYL